MNKTVKQVTLSDLPVNLTCSTFMKDNKNNTQEITYADNNTIAGTESDG
jgi:hypothetical protein